MPLPVGRFKKRREQEAFLGLLNDALLPLEKRLYRELPEEFPTVQVLGLPRSGTTLLLQTIIGKFEIGYINNLVARFWKAPMIGLRLAKCLGTLSGTSSFQSDFGRTSGLDEPHEFGYFWSRYLGYEAIIEPTDAQRRRIDWCTLRKVIVNMCHEVQAPIAFKGFLIQWHLRELVDLLPKTCFVRIQRDPIEVAMSILRMRREFYGSDTIWASMKPKEFSWLKDEPYWRQIAGQVYYLEQSLHAGLAEIPRENLVQVTLDDLLARPGFVLEEVAQVLERNGWVPTIAH